MTIYIGPFCPGNTICTKARWKTRFSQTKAIGAEEVYEQDSPRKRRLMQRFITTFSHQSRERDSRSNQKSVYSEVLC